MNNNQQKTNVRVYLGSSFLSLAIGILGIVVGALYLNKITCDGSMVRLPVWLLVVGCVSIVTGSSTIYIIKTTKQQQSADGTNLTVRVVQKKYIGSTIAGFFLIAWNVVGAVALFRDSMDCHQECPPVWIVTLVILCIQWASIGIVLFGCCCGCVFGIVKSRIRQ